MFAGTMGTGQALDAALEAAALCRQTLPECSICVRGGGVDRSRLEQKAEDLGLTNVRFLPRQPISAMGAVLGLADVLLVHLKRRSSLQYHDTVEDSGLYGFGETCAHGS